MVDIMTRKCRTDDEVRAHIYKNIIEVGDCWIWQLTLNIGGYGKIGYEAKCQPTHRVAYKLFIGDVSEGMVVRHHPSICNNPACCNPYHLLLGTQGDNNRDKVVAGTQVYGCDSPNSKLSEDDVRFIRSGKLKGAELARLFNLSESVISRIKLGITYKNVS